MSRRAQPETRRSAAGTSTARCPAGFRTGCSTRRFSCGASRSTAIQRCRSIPAATDASVCRCGWRRESTVTTLRARRSTSTDPDHMAEQNDDPLIRQLREQISDADRTIVEAINARLKLVARLKAYKESRGMSFVDPEREELMLNYLARANRGPLSADGLREIFGEILDLTKREVARDDAD